MGGNREMRIQILEMNIRAYGESNTLHSMSNKWVMMLVRIQNVLWTLFD